MSGHPRLFYSEIALLLVLALTGNTLMHINYLEDLRDLPFGPKDEKVHLLWNGRLRIYPYFERSHKPWASPTSQ